MAVQFVQAGPQVLLKHFAMYCFGIAILINLPGLSTTWLRDRLYHALWITNLHPQSKYQPDAMDPRFAEKINGKLLRKIGTLACFLLAGGLLITSLFVPPPAQNGADGGIPQGITSSIR